MVVSEPNDLKNFMRDKDITAFKRTARHFGVYILVRRLNPESKDRIGKPDCDPKPIDCKAKTAKKSFYHSGLGRHLDIGGLVVNPTLPGFEAAYPNGAHAEAVKEWNKFGDHLAPPPARQADGGYVPAWIPGKRYFVDMDPNSSRYGAVKLTPTGLVSAAKYIHGDYDLYAIVAKEEPASNTRVRETLHGQPHTRGREFKDVQYMLNREMGVTMVLHGSQEKFKTDMDDQVDAFYPDGQTVVCLRGSQMIGSFYAKELKGRLMYRNPELGGRPDFGLWEVR